MLGFRGLPLPFLSFACLSRCVRWGVVGGRKAGTFARLREMMASESVGMQLAPASPPGASSSACIERLRQCTGVTGVLCLDEASGLVRQSGPLFANSVAAQQHAHELGRLLPQARRYNVAKSTQSPQNA